MSLRTACVALLIAAASAAVPTAEPQNGAANRLTPEEQKAGWKLLFDGRSLDGWRGYKRPDAAGSRWKIEDGFLMLPADDGRDTLGARDIISKETFQQF